MHSAAGYGVRSMTQVQVIIPQDPAQKRRIDRLAKYIVKEGYQFEVLVRRSFSLLSVSACIQMAVAEREVSNPGYAFLFKNGTPENVYYRWRVFSLCQVCASSHRALLSSHDAYCTFHTGGHH